jgi:hypothetical protein
MIPQSNFMVLAAVTPSREAELRLLLASMNDAPGRVNANNALFPFAQFDRIHVARFLIIDDKTTGDVSAYNLPPANYPLYLCFLGDIDGDADSFLDDVVTRAEKGLRTLFGCCDGYDAGTDLWQYVRDHRVESSANYINWLGRTVNDVREEAALHDALQTFVRGGPSVTARELHRAAQKFVRDETAVGRLTLTPDPPTPLGWKIRNVAHLVGVPVALIIASPALVVAGVLGVLQLRQMEKTDPVLCDRCDPAHSEDLALLEDHDVTNQFTAMGTLKPGALRLWSTIAAFFAIDYAARHVFNRGGLARVRTIHFARWVFLDKRRRAVFFSNYDGSLEAYMDDFINKVGFGLNVAFNGGIGYPRTRWLALDGCSDERSFKEYLRRHQVPTQVWYKAYPGLTAVDLERNTRIRRGLEVDSLSEPEAAEWAALL